jgi:hypothetical protein
MWRLWRFDAFNVAVFWTFPASVVCCLLLLDEESALADWLTSLRWQIERMGKRLGKCIWSDSDEYRA